MKPIATLTLLVFFISFGNSQPNSDNSKHNIVKNTSELSANQGKTALVQGKLVAFQPIANGKTDNIEKWEWEIILSDNTKVPVRGNPDKAKFESLLNKNVNVLGEIIAGKTSESEVESGFRIIYSDIFISEEPISAEKITEVTEELENYPRLKEIFAKYHGKVILVDFWASWCKPCIKEMKPSGILHDELKDKDIVFLYLAYRDQAKAWESAKSRLEIEGEHILLDAETMKEAKSLFQFIGIPWYVVIGKDGYIVTKNAPRPSNPQLKELLLKEIAR
jgi:thiol-disulfide isomerase/thioredoxin